MVWSTASSRRVAGRSGTRALRDEGPRHLLRSRGDGSRHHQGPHGGFETVISEFTFTVGGRFPTHGGVGAGEFKGSRFSGTFEFTPTQGDCITAPVTKAKVFGEGILHG